MRIAVLAKSVVSHLAPTRHLTWSMIAVAATLAACAKDDSALPANMVDERVRIPKPDSMYVDIVTPDVVIEPGEEKIFCYHVTSRGPLATGGVRVQQGPSGHHVGLFTSLDPKPHGTLEDCSGPEENVPLRWFVLDFTPLPEGYAIDVPSGTPLVLQSHYINPTDRPIVVRDVARMLRVNPDEVTTWASTLIATDLDFKIAPGPLTRSWDCRLEQPYELLVFNGHMHELGTSFEVELSNGAGSMQSIYKHDPWGGREFAPTNSYYENPLPLAAGSVIRTTCKWLNTTNHVVGFPEEMCVLFAYIGGSREPLQCSPQIVGG